MVKVRGLIYLWIMILDWDDGSFGSLCKYIKCKAVTLYTVGTVVTHYLHTGCSVVTDLELICYFSNFLFFAVFSDVSGLRPISP